MPLFHKQLKDRLIERGWSREEAERTHNLINDPDRQAKHQPVRMQMNLIVYWMVLTVLTIGNFMISLVLIPFLLILSPTQALVVVAILGIIFGLLFNLLIFDIEHIETMHHYAAAVFIPIIAILNMYFMTSVSNKFALQIQSGGHESPFLISAVYVVMFIIPYVVTVVRSELKKRRERMYPLSSGLQQEQRG